MKHYLFWLLFSILLLGCRRLPERPEGMPELTPCTISVTFGGERLKDVGILLRPKDPQTHPWTAGGRTDAGGQAIMKTAAYYNGVVPGEYFVTFQKYAEPELGKDGMPLPAESLIPIRYSRSQTAETLIVLKSKADYVFTLDGLKPSGNKKQ